MEAVTYDHLLGVVFTDPQVAIVGLLPAELRKRGIEFLSADYPFDDHGKSILMEAKYGYVAVHAEKSRWFSERNVLGKDAGELIQTLSIAVSSRRRCTNWRRRIGTTRLCPKSGLTH